MTILKSLLAGVCATLAVANPLPAPEADQLQSRQFITDSNELMAGPCKDVTLIFTRGSAEIGNMGLVIGPQLCQALKAQISPNRVACQGVEGQYVGLIKPNFLDYNTDPKSIQTAKTTIEEAASKCPNTQIVAGGYSQGSAVIDYAVQELNSDTRNKLKGVVLFGFTRNKQDHGQIPGYPQDKVKVYCAPGDVVCDGILVITPSHQVYGVNAGDAADFLARQVNLPQ
ncbi:cutinase precursor [Aspergillus homomorphus CBS 101889]|uniref:Cutinase n=1 Tax=Aspergillus homomorphus (strain CBS 101889) TaxID=1450537 RepID=A0A395HZB8_ASPHC|nr:cutinase precursor [Aspergillus homomorphus CBS 101889]RAL12886.1 cutinase precursor [Aspergillus homomorphus CBS 101889]